MLIPKIIFQTWKDENIPEKWMLSKISINRYMKDWQYVLMTDNDNLKFTEKYFPDFLEIYNNLEYPIQRADMIRYMILYVHGGLYMDLDYEIKKPLDPLFLNGELFLTNSPNFMSYVTNSFMASKKNHPFWIEVLNEIKKRYKEGIGIFNCFKHFKIIMTTGPGVVDFISKKNKISLIDYKELNPYNICEKKFLKESYLIPLEGCSWGGNDTKFGNWLYCNSFEILILLFFIVILLLLFNAKKLLKNN